MSHTNPQAEQWILGALLDVESPMLRLSPSQLLAASSLAPEDFTADLHRAAFRAIQNLAERQRPTDPQSVFSVLKASGNPDDTTLRWLFTRQAENTANREAFLSHAETIKTLSRRRQLAEFHRKQLQALERPDADPTSLGGALEAFAQRFSATVAPDETGDADIYELAEEWAAAIEGKRLPVVPTGIEVLDDEIGGFVNNLNVIGGMPSVGKSALVAEVVGNLLNRGMRVGLFGLEDATKWVAKRHLARRVGIQVQAVGSGRLSAHHQEALQVSMGEMSQVLKNLVVYRRAGIEAEALVQRARHWVLNLGVQAIFVDHGGEVTHGGGNRDRFDLAVASTYRALRDLAVNHKVPVIVLCHFNRDTDNQHAGVPRLTSFAESEYIARMARVALGLWRQPGDDAHLRVTVLKQTEGKRGQSVELDMDVTAALVRSRGGRPLNLEAEARAASEAAKEARKSKVSDWRAQ